MKLRKLNSAEVGFDDALDALTRYEAAQDATIDQSVRTIIERVRREGDAALCALTTQFDGMPVSNVAQLDIGQEELARALREIPAAQAHALRTAAERIQRYHAHQRLQSWQYAEADGTVLGQRISALDRVGLYVPGGKAAYPSSVLMNAIPAKVAGVRELIMVSPTPRGERNALVLAAAALAGVDRVLTIGGAQAVAALAYGTNSIPRVDKIVGPGNAYVAAAKRQVFGVVGIDMIAGPSEILVIADGSVPAEWVAMDLFSQAEHDEIAQSILLCPDAAYIDAVALSMQRLLPSMPRATVIAASLQHRGALIQTRDLAEACAISNRIAPEHLELAIAHPNDWLAQIHHAGAVFVGRYSSESLGDYCAGPNHVLPTAGTARFSSPLGVYDFQKRSSLIQISEAGARTLGPIAVTLAEGEGLQAHARSAEYRQ